MLESFLLRWGYLAIGVGTFFEGEVILLAAGAIAHRGSLSLPLVIGAAFIGSVVGDQLWFQLGRHLGRRVVEQRERWQTKLAFAERRLSRHGSLFVFGFRFIYGLRTITPLFLGASGYPLRRFVLLNMIGAATWAAAFGGLGWALGASLATLLRRTARIEELILASAAVVLAAWALHRWFQRRNRGVGPEATSAPPA